jgi:hypothetical protein
MHATFARYGAAIAAATFASLLGAPVATDAATDPGFGGKVAGLVGRWSGGGSAEFKDGSVEPFKCVVTYLTDKSGQKVQQTIRCNSSKLDLNVVSDWKVSDGSISGTWKETKYELDGTLIGNLESDGYNLYAENQFANATISVKATACRQDVIMKFSKQVDLLTAALTKC